jgi:hypothetical protein
LELAPDCAEGAVMESRPGIIIDGAARAESLLEERILEF